jgi:hypothetical protein
MLTAAYKQQPNTVVNAETPPPLLAQGWIGTQRAEI